MTVALAVGKTAITVSFMISSSPTSCSWYINWFIGCRIYRNSANPASSLVLLFLFSFTKLRGKIGFWLTRNLLNPNVKKFLQKVVHRFITPLWTMTSLEIYKCKPVFHWSKSNKVLSCQFLKNAKSSLGAVDAEFL